MLCLTLAAPYAVGAVDAVAAAARRDAFRRQQSLYTCGKVREGTEREPCLWATVPSGCCGRI